MDLNIIYLYYTSFDCNNITFRLSLMFLILLISLLKRRLSNDSFGPVHPYILTNLGTKQQTQFVTDEQLTAQRLTFCELLVLTINKGQLFANVFDAHRDCDAFARMVLLN